MKNFKGFDDWIEIFRGGKQIDSTGREHDGDAVIDRAVATFSAKKHEPPVVVGHPKDNAPAFGWVADLKKSGNLLLAKFKDIVPEFKDAVAKGMYKKRSASFYPDGRLRHVGFLGAMPPAVKGLTDLSFSDDDDAMTFEFSETNPWTWQTIADVFRKLREWLLENEGRETADAIIPDWDIKTVEDEKTASLKPDSIEAGFSETKTQEEDAMFTEEQMEAAKTQAAGEERKKVEAEFAEKQRTAKQEAVRQQISSFCDTMLNEGKIIPAWAKSGLSEFMQSLEAVDEIEFSEGKSKESQLAWFKNFLEELPKTVNFKEIALRDTDISTGDAAAKLEKYTKEKMSEKKIGYSAAFAEVQTEHPGLVTEYMDEMKG